MRPEGDKINLRFFSIELPLKRTFRVSSASTVSKKNYFLSVDNKYFGEAARSIHYGPNEEQVIGDLERAIDFISSRPFESTVDLIELSRLDINSVSKAAVTTALLHYLSDKKQEYPWQLVGLDEPVDISTSFTVSINRLDLMLEEINGSPYPIIKIKMGFEDDLLLMSQLKNISGKLFRIDANGGWTVEKAEKMMYHAKQADIDIIEQPTEIEFIKEWKYLNKSSKISIFIDEGLNDFENYCRYIDFVDGVNIKMAKSGGIFEACKIARQAKRDNIKVMLGCMVESTIGIAPAVYMSSLADYFDLDGPLLLDKNIAGGLKFNVEQITVDEDIIGGPKLIKEYLNV